jgi:O-antigen ligase
MFVALDRNRMMKLADGAAIALAASLPWSTSATGILAVVWLVATIPTVDLASLRRIVFSPAGALPLILVALGTAGMLWANVSWSERYGGVGSFAKLLAIPLLLLQFSHSQRGGQALIAFLASCVLLMAASWLLLAWPTMPWPSQMKNIGVPVKDYNAQSAVFTICIFAIAQISYNYWCEDRRRIAILLVILDLVFIANIFYVATSRTYLFLFPVLLLVFGYRLFSWKGAVVLLAGFLMLAAAAWPSASSMRLRVGSLAGEIASYRPSGEATSAGERLTFWKKSIHFIELAPMIGHGTGSIRDQFRRSVADQTGMAAEVAANPHNQILAVGIQLGFVGIAALLAMWMAHIALFRLTLFRSGNLAEWVGLVVVLQNMGGSLFNSHLFDFTHGWLYVVGVGVAGGVALKQAR